MRQKEKKKKIENQKKPKKKNRKKMLLLLTAPVENLSGCDDIDCEFAMCNFNLRDQATKRKCV